ncbi:hypothetical protein BDD14_5745 [Edaphobacter modestus]|uniref:Uncharacterized protein n=1 Tax=Edaphobacter modestus TaxID=388466 RepID=A0A4Q7YEA4_9BACT|nr:hypothetical protein BDD14_5745 [Edaphobacter modestus]
MSGNEHFLMEWQLGTLTLVNTDGVLSGPICLNICEVRKSSR